MTHGRQRNASMSSRGRTAPDRLKKNGAGLPAPLPQPRNIIIA